MGATTMFLTDRPTSPLSLSNNNEGSNQSSVTCRQAALNRGSQKLAKHHPNVKLPPRLQDKSKKEQVLRCSDRLKSYPAAVDTPIRALTALSSNPSNIKFRRINKSTAGYQRSLANVPGAEQLLLTMNYSAVGPNTLYLDYGRLDSNLLQLGLSALEEIKATPEYKDGKQKLEFNKNIKQEIANADDAEKSERVQYLSRLPKEASESRGALMYVILGDQTIHRRFEGDDTLQDVLNWIGGQSTVIPKRLLSRQWSLVDVNRFPMAPIDCERNADKTLQYIGFWPSGKLEVRPSSQEWVDGVVDWTMGASRGLGSAPSDTLR